MGLAHLFKRTDKPLDKLTPTGSDKDLGKPLKRKTGGHKLKNPSAKNFSAIKKKSQFWNRA
jgi:hypothetical protein